MRRYIAVVIGILLAVLTAVAQTPQQPAGGAPAAPGAAAPQAPAGRQGAPAGRGRGGPPARIVTFEARPATIKPGESTVLNWLVENPAAPAIEPGLGRVTPRGTRRMTPSATTTYTLTMGADDVDGVSPFEGDLGRRRSPLEEIRGNVMAAGLEAVERDGSWRPR